MPKLRKEHPLVWYSLQLHIPDGSVEYRTLLADAQRLASTQKRTVDWDFIKRLSTWRMVLDLDVKIARKPEGVLEYYRLFGYEN